MIKACLLFPGRLGEYSCNELNCLLWIPEPLKPDYFFFSFVTPRIVAEGTDACFIKALGLMPTICLNCLEKW